MKEILLSLSQGENLSIERAEEAMRTLMQGQATPAQIAAYLTLLRSKGETVEELTGSAKIMRAFATAIPSSDLDLIDTCGTGGDHTGTFNISTAAALVLAAGQVPVAKHGNRAASSLTGSADVLTALGIPIDLAPESAAQCLQETGFCFLFAQTYHPAMKHVAPIRKELGFRTMFNILGPLTNPARPKYQILGTPTVEIAEKMAQVLAALGCERAWVVTSHDGLDEISIADRTDVFEVREHVVTKQLIHPRDFDLPTHSLAEIQGGDAQANATILRAIFAGSKGAPRDVVVINAAAAFYVAGRVATLAEGARLAERLLDDGSVQRKLQQIIAFGRDRSGGEVTA